MKLVCVGGHHDGQWVETREPLLTCSQPTIRLPILEYDTHPVGSGDDPAVEMKAEYYIMQSIYTPEYNSVLHHHESVRIASFWRHESMTEMEGIRRLVAGYGPTLALRKLKES